MKETLKRPRHVIRKHLRLDAAQTFPSNSRPLERGIRLDSVAIRTGKTALMFRSSCCHPKTNSMNVITLPPSWCPCFTGLIQTGGNKQKYIFSNTLHNLEKGNTQHPNSIPPQHWQQAPPQSFNTSSF